MKRIFCISLVFVSFFAIGCASTPALRVPGESSVVGKNITAEYLKIAEGYEGLKNYSKAVEYYEKAAQTNPDLGDAAYYKIGRCYALSKDWASAKTVFEKLLEKDPENKSLKTSLAYIAAMSGDLADASLRYRELSEAYPTDDSLLKNYIAILMADGKYELAEEQFYILKERFPDEPTLSDLQTKLADGLGL